MQTEKPKFVQFEDKRIKLSNIKDYGISTKKVYFQKVYQPNNSEPKGILGQLNNEKWIHIEGREAYAGEIDDTEIVHYLMGSFKMKMLVWEPGSNKGVHTIDQEVNKGDLFTKEAKCLYVKTYQNENHEFPDFIAKFDIYEKCKELDELLS